MIILFGIADPLLISGNISTPFQVSDDAVGIHSNVMYAASEGYQVYDTVGLGELHLNENPHSEAVQRIRGFFSQARVSPN